MQLRSLEHLVEAVQALARPVRVVVLRSSALLGVDARLGNPGEMLETSCDADLLLTPVDEDTARMLQEAMGEGSLFHSRYACFADILRPDIVETFPAGWAQRLVPLAGHAGAFYLDPHDLALVKAAPGGAKDMESVGGLLKRGCIQPAELRRRFQASGWNEHRMKAAGRNLERLLTEHNVRGRPGNGFQRRNQAEGRT
jgi:hypothetical protein